VDTTAFVWPRFTFGAKRNYQTHDPSAARAHLAKTRVVNGHIRTNNLDPAVTRFTQLEFAISKAVIGDPLLPHVREIFK
jgi:hypothetical protein